MDNWEENEEVTSSFRDVLRGAEEHRCFLKKLKRSWITVETR